MRRRLKTGIIAGSLASLIMGGGLLYAQQGDTPEAAEATEVEATIEGEQKVELTPAEMSEQSNKLIEAMREGLKEVIEVQKIARKQQDVIKLNCVNDKLLQVKQLLNISEGASTDMREAIAQGEENERYHQYGKIVISAEKVDGLVEEAKNCIGEELIYLGPLQINVDKPDVEDPNQSPWPDVTIEPPAYASPFA